LSVTAARPVDDVVGIAEAAVLAARNVAAAVPDLDRAAQGPAQDIRRRQMVGIGS
jgi:hypothetical protein